MKKKMVALLKPVQEEVVEEEEHYFLVILMVMGMTVFDVLEGLIVMTIMEMWILVLVRFVREVLMRIVMEVWMKVLMWMVTGIQLVEEIVMMARLV